MSQVWWSVLEKYNSSDIERYTTESNVDERGYTIFRWEENQPSCVLKLQG